jgi:hypothetical protein
MLLEAKSLLAVQLTAAQSEKPVHPEKAESGSPEEKDANKQSWGSKCATPTTSHVLMKDAPEVA